MDFSINLHFSEQNILSHTSQSFGQICRRGDALVKLWLSPLHRIRGPCKEGEVPGSPPDRADGLTHSTVPRNRFRGSSFFTSSSFPREACLGIPILYQPVWTLCWGGWEDTAPRSVTSRRVGGSQTGEDALHKTWFSRRRARSPCPQYGGFELWLGSWPYQSNTSHNCSRFWKNVMKECNERMQWKNVIERKVIERK